MIHRISVTVTEKGLKFNASDNRGVALEQIWLSACHNNGGTGGRWAPRAESLAVWHLSGPLDRLAQSMVPLAARLVRSLRMGRLPGMRSLTFDIVHGGVDCHVCLSSFDEVLLHYPLPCGKVVDPIVEAGQISALPQAFLSIFNQAVKTRFSALAAQLGGASNLLQTQSIKKEDAA